MKLRLYHHRDGARIAYREAGTGPPLALLHSASSPTGSGSRPSSTSPTASALVLPDLPLHGDSEDRPRHPYTLDWFAEVLAGVLRARCCGPRPLVAGHGARRGDPAARRRRPARCARRGWCSCPTACTARRRRAPRRRAWRVAARAAAVPGLDRALATARGCVVPARASACGCPRAATRRRATSSATPSPTSAATPNLARSLGALRRALAARARSASCSTPTRACDCRCCCCGPTRTACTRCAAPRRRSTCCPDGQLRVLPGTGYLIAYDDPVGVARELAAFCG